MVTIVGILNVSFWQPENVSKRVNLIARKRVKTCHFDGFTSCEKLWQAVTGCDKLWRAVTGCDRLWQAVTTSRTKLLRSIGLWDVCDKLWQIVYSKYLTSPHVRTHIQPTRNPNPTLELAPIVRSVLKSNLSLRCWSHLQNILTKCRSNADQETNLTQRNAPGQTNVLTWRSLMDASTMDWPIKKIYIYATWVIRISVLCLVPNGIIFA